MLDAPTTLPSVAALAELQSCNSSLVGLVSQLQAAVFDGLVTGRGTGEAGTQELVEGMTQLAIENATAGMVVVAENKSCVLLPTPPNHLSLSLSLALSRSLARALALALAKHAYMCMRVFVRALLPLFQSKPWPASR